MTARNCSADQLKLLMEDKLTIEQSGMVLQHVEECSHCQSALDTFAAEATWWSRVERGLAGTSVDGSGELPKPQPIDSSIDALLEEAAVGNQPSFSFEATLEALEPATHPELLGRIDEFDIEEQVGRGGMGVVFRGYDRSLNRPVAIKVMAPHVGTQGVAAKRFSREAQAAAAIVHPNVVPIYRVSSARENPYIAMAFIDGRSLQEHISTHGSLETREIVRIAMQVADGLAAAHRQGVVHRDIKPANILMDKDVNRVMITDFGLARSIDDVTMTQSGCLAGTPNYMSPEQITGKKVNARSDLFSLGSVMYFLATGREPFRSESTFAVINRITRETPPPVRSINPDIPETLSRIIARLLERSPKDRFQSAEQLNELLTRYLAHLQNPASHTKPQVYAPPSRLRQIRNRIAIGVALTSLFATLTLTVWSLLDSRGNGDGHDHDERHHREHHAEGGQEHRHTDSDHD